MALGKLLWGGSQSLLESCTQLEGPARDRDLLPLPRAAHTALFPHRLLEANLEYRLQGCLQNIPALLSDQHFLNQQPELGVAATEGMASLPVVPWRPGCLR